MNEQAYDLLNDLAVRLTQLRFRLHLLEFQLTLADAQLKAVLEKWHKRRNSRVN